MKRTILKARKLRLYGSVILMLALLLTFILGSPKLFVAKTTALPFNYTVTNELDSGPGSLREAINLANTNSNPDSIDIINFNIPTSSGDVTITVNSDIVITEPVTINGYSQPGSVENSLSWPGPFNGNLRTRVEFSGSKFIINSQNTKLTGLVLTNLEASSDRLLSINASNVQIEGNYFNVLHNGYFNGTNTGTSSSAIYVTSGSNISIGGVNPNQRNLLGYCSQSCIRIDGSSSYDISIAGNSIGTGPDAITSLDSSYYGAGKDSAITITNFAHHINIGLPQEGGGNTISHNPFGSITATDTNNINIRNNDIYYNWISGIKYGSGIYFNGVTDSVVGGDNLLDKNYIAGNSTYAIVLDKSEATLRPSERVSILNNIIGKNRFNHDFPNANGIITQGESNQILIKDNTIYGNNNLLPYAQSSDNDSGVVVRDNSQDISITSNNIYGNNGIPIDIQESSNSAPLVNNNDLLDGDIGANGLLNSPEIVALISTSSTSNTINYVIDVPAGQYLIQVFETNSLGSKTVATQTVTSDGNGYEFKQLELDNASTSGISLTITEIDSDSYFGYRATSEHSSEVNKVFESDLRINIVDTPSPYAQPGSTVTYGVRVANDGPGSVDSFVVDINQTNCTTTNVVVVNGSSTATTPGTYDSLTGLWQGALDMNQELYLQVTCTTTGSVGQNIDIAADVDTGTVINPSVPNVDPDMANNTATASVPISAISDDSIVGTLQTTGPILNGTNFIVRQTISNLGAGPSSAAGGLSVIFVLPPNVSFNSVTDINISDNYDLVGCSVIPGASSAQGYPDSSDAVMCTVTSTTNELSPGDSFSIDFNLQANADLIPGVSRFDSFIVDFGGSSTDPDSGVVSNGLGTGTGYSLTNPPVNNNVSVVTYTLDPLTATITPCAGQANPTTINDACFTLQFNKPINESTLELSDLVSSNGTIYSLIKLDSTTWELRVKDMNPGAVTVNIATGTVTDLEIMALSNNPSSSIIYQLPPSSEPQQNTTNSNTNTDPSLSSTGHTIYRAMIIAGVVIVGGVGMNNITKGRKNK
jgi:hypothetical protein